MSNHKFIRVWEENGIGRIELNRTKVLNAINRPMVTEIITALEQFDRDHDVSAIVINGGGRAFAAGADIDEMAGDTPVSLELLNQFAEWDRIQGIKKPIIAAVHGFALGGGFELVLSCDVVFAAEDAKFGFPEVKLGVMPGAGGTVKLTKAMGKAKALEWLWTGDSMDAAVAERHGLITRLVAPEVLLEEALAFAARLVQQAPLSLRLIKDTVNKAIDYSVYEGMQAERKNFYLLFASRDQKEGMKAFIEKRPPEFRGE
ncbi:short chain enoyl-CoA hydratase [Scopulibacillus darangshiensis]|uniref:Short chain enoyl-CoA hydratase n=1 Tax=Scopulibacillus darangshiensis TaxID=442528 RepID=A0A4R2P3D2_9BACL|nr:enoyl-CoA hydratase-related protein [Scopulibacillus darangshiensis]TCP29250.1 short chain enoyl-CoA hydratase [Scopulibacillus darangshiensis]